MRDVVDTFCTAWSKVARVMGSDFAPYVGYVIPDLLKKASARPTIQPLESKSDNMAVQQIACSL